MALHLITYSDLKNRRADMLVIPVCEDREIHDSTPVMKMIKAAKVFKEFKGEKEDELILHHLPESHMQRVIFIGMGKYDRMDQETFRQAAGKAVKKSITWGLQEIIFALPTGEQTKMAPESVLEALMEGACLANHLFDKYKKEIKKKTLEEIGFLVQSNVKTQCKGLPLRIQSICDGTLLARDWVSMPPNDKTPEKLSRLIEDCAAKMDLKVAVWDEKELKRQHCDAILAVAAGSRNKPRMVLLEYASPVAEKTVVLVGKGVTFDSGGINLKPTESLEDMKMDMSGAAAVAATLVTIAGLKPNLKIIGVIPIVENMPSGDASRPGDIIGTHSGKSVEIGNTDAEGRLILIDAISYAKAVYQPQYIIDIATLTGACVVALGEKIAGVFACDDELADAIVQSGQRTFERCWRMPLPDDYQELLKSDFADIKNIGHTRWGGAITAALFLKEFVGDTSWAHVDIAGPAYLKKENAYCRAGGTGFGVRLLCDLLERMQP